MECLLSEKKYRLKVSSSIINFRNRAERTWGVERYRFPWDIFKPAVFFGMYHVLDYAYLALHRGKKYILWAGHDLVNLINSRLLPKILKAWLIMKAENYVENELEEKELLGVGIKSLVRPSFVDDIDKYPLTFQRTFNPHVFLTAHPDREDEYGWGLISRIYKELPEITFHLYGSGRPRIIENVVVHGRVPEDQFNEEIKSYHCGLRPNEHDGNSEIAMKSVLCGGYPITRIKYPHIWNYETEEELVELLKRLKYVVEPNIEAREFWRKNVNNYPWTKKR